MSPLIIPVPNDSSRISPGAGAEDELLGVWTAGIYLICEEIFRPAFPAGARACPGTMLRGFPLQKALSNNREMEI